MESEGGNQEGWDRGDGFSSAGTRINGCEARHRVALRIWKEQENSEDIYSIGRKSTIVNPRRNAKGRQMYKAFFVLGGSGGLITWSGPSDEWP